ncbi:flagellar basal body-associated protein FliL [Falsihalocynthiibacter sp. SS001]|uniref:flagellar basal body-associated FliL family protein n=1 Tax=Falsihalocynthiibacter sp. SS001 TaxID=3349698 RepID=UPI0036D38F67
MSDATISNAGINSRRISKKALLLGLFLFLASGGIGFAVVQLGIFPLESAATKATHKEQIDELPRIAFVPLDPLIISLGGTGKSKHLRFSAQLEVEPEYIKDVENLRPRIVDMLNSYLRAVRPSDLEEPTALIMLRAQMLRRINIVTGEGRVRDLLIMEFVLN